MGVRLAGILAVVPSRVLGIDELEQHMSRQDAQRIVDLTGVRHRHVAGDSQTAADLGEAASRALFNEIGLSPARLDGIVFVTQTPDYVLPATACILQHRLGLPKAALAFDVNHGCAGYPYGLAIGHSLIASGLAKRLLVVVGDTITKRIDPSDRGTYPLFGDAAAATVLVESQTDDDFLAFDLGSDGAGWHRLVVPVGQSRYRNPGEFERCAADEVRQIPNPERLYMDGNHIFAFTLREVPGVVERTLSSAGTSASEVDYFFVHQANRFIIRHLCDKIGVPPEKSPLSMDRYGNTSAPSPALTACDAVGGLEPATSLVSLFLGFGVGFSWGGALVKLRSECVFPIQEC
ncbi:MAG: 3-oxoacyl-ACP synthase III family protein [Planctomycetota bacterium]|jgi:3-oxoacyl-[acyl-carrier-protein] synthase-3